MLLVWLVLTFSPRFIKVANETMCRPIRALTEARGYALQKHVYVWLPLVLLKWQFLTVTHVADSQALVVRVANTLARSQSCSGSRRLSFIGTAQYCRHMDLHLQIGRIDYARTLPQID